MSLKTCFFFPALILISVATSAQITTANNGLSTSGSNVSLGGTLTDNTTIDLGTSFYFRVSKGTNDFIKVNNNGQVGIGGDVILDASAALQVASATKGFLLPRLSTTQRDAISSPSAGLQVYNTTTNTIDLYNGTGWSSLSSFNGLVRYADGSFGMGVNAAQTSNYAFVVNNGFGAGILTPMLNATNGLKTDNGNGRYVSMSSADASLYFQAGTSYMQQFVATPETAGPDYNTGDAVIKAGRYATTYYNLALGGYNGISTKIFGSSLNVGIGTNTDIPSALLHLNSTSKGFLLPRLTTAQRDAISSPATGLQLYNTTTNTIDLYNGTAWTSLGSGGAAGNGPSGIGGNTVLGYQAYYVGNQTSGANTALGYQALMSSASGTDNIAIGYQALKLSNGGYYNIAIGNGALQKSSTAGGNNALGWHALGNVTTSGSNSAFGENVFASTNGGDNSGFGFEAGYGNTGSQNVAIGSLALHGVGSGTFNSVVGKSAANSNTTGQYNSIFGYSAINYNTAGSFNTILGSLAGRLDGSSGNNVTGIDNSILIGYDSRPNANNETNQIVIGNGVYGLGSNTTVIGNSSTTLTALRGSVAVNATSANASAVLDINANNKGFLPPRLTTAQRDAISSPATGLLIYNTTTKEINHYNGTSWTAASPWSFDGSTWTNSQPFGTDAETNRFDNFGGGVGRWFNLNQAIVQSNNQIKLDIGGFGTAVLVKASKASFSVPIQLQSQTYIQQAGIPSPLDGYLIYNSSTRLPTYYNGTEWVSTNASPKFTTAERDAIVSPATGSQIYNTTTNTIDLYNGTGWTSLISGGGGSAADQNLNSAWTASGANIYSKNLGNVGIGTTNPTNRLTVSGNISATDPNNGYIINNPNDGGIEIASGNNEHSYIDFKGNTTLNSDFQGRISYTDGNGFDFLPSPNIASKVRINLYGNVGIGMGDSTNIKAKLHVQSPEGGTVLLDGLGAYGAMSLNGTFSDWNMLSASFDRNLYFNRPSLNDMYFRKGNDINQMALKADGNLGIGIGINGAVNSEARLTVSGPSLENWDPQDNISKFNGNGLRINSTNNDVAKPYGQNAITYQSGLNGGGAAIAFGRGGSWDTFMSFYTNDHDNSKTGNIRERMRLDEYGNLGIGTTNPHEKLSVNGNILAKKVKVSIKGEDWSDYVFDNSYKLQSLSTVEKYIAKHKHLPDVPSAKAIEKTGLDVGSSQAMLLRKIEELTLYVIDLKKDNVKQEKQNQLLQKRIERLESGAHK